ncbi:MAG: hypothetical protein ACRDL6_04110 [Solirubrobacterales bacterium]
MAADQWGMRHVLATIASTVALAAALLAAPGSATAGKCGNYAGSAVIATGEVPCRKAKAIVKEFLKVRKSSIQGYNCNGSRTRVFCRLDAKSIRWKK